MGLINRKLTAALFVPGILLMHACGDKCEHPEKTYSIYSSAYARAERSSKFNLARGLLLDETVTGYVELTPAWQTNIPPNKYVVMCGTKESGHYFEFYITKQYADGSYRFIYANSLPKGSVYSEVLDANDLENIVSISCGIQLPEDWTCDERFNDYDPYPEVTCSLAQQREYIGMVTAKLASGVDCFDWYYDDKYHEAADE